MFAWSVAFLLCQFPVSCRLFIVLNSGVLLLQAYWPCHLGTDNLNVARTMGGLLDRDCLAKPLFLVKDGDLVALAQYMIRTRGRETVRVTKVKGHATDADVEQGRVRLVDLIGNAEADAAADLGWRHQSELIMDAWRCLLKVRTHTTTTTTTSTTTTTIKPTTATTTNHHTPHTTHDTHNTQIHKHTINNQ